MEKTWKITNLSQLPVKFACRVSNTITKGVMLKPGEFCIAQEQMTKTIDAQSRRKIITIDKEYDNSITNFPLGEPLNAESAGNIVAEAALNAKKYINQN
jgi:hypothetical protein